MFVCAFSLLPRSLLGCLARCERSPRSSPHRRTLSFYAIHSQLLNCILTYLFSVLLLTLLPNFQPASRKKLVTLQRSISAEPRDVATAPPLVGSASAGGEKERAGSYADGEAGKDARGEHRGA